MSCNRAGPFHHLQWMEARIEVNHIREFWRGNLGTFLSLLLLHLWVPSSHFFALIFISAKWEEITAEEAELSKASFHVGNFNWSVTMLSLSAFGFRRYSFTALKDSGGARFYTRDVLMSSMTFKGSRFKELLHWRSLLISSFRSCYLAISTGGCGLPP